MPLNVIGLMIGSFPLIGWVTAFILVALLYGVFKEYALSVKKLPICAKTIFWIALSAFCLTCSYWILDVDNAIPCRAIDETDKVCWCYNVLELQVWLIGGAFPFSACIIGYLVRVHKVEKMAHTKRA